MEEVGCLPSCRPASWLQIYDDIPKDLLELVEDAVLFRRPGAWGGESSRRERDGRTPCSRGACAPAAAASLARLLDPLPSPCQTQLSAS